jgi:O-antigen/teichoic acid export membrane protein
MRGPVRNAGYLLAGEAASRVFGFLTTAVLARRLGPEGFGQIGFAAAFLAYGVVLTDLGLVTVGTRSVAQDRTAAAGLAGDLAPLRILLGLAAAVVMLLVALVLPKPATVKWLLLLYAGVVLVQSAMLEWVFIGSEKMGFVSLSRVVTNCAYFGMVLALVGNTGSILRVPVAFGAATVLGGLILLSAYVAGYGLPRLRLRKARWRELLRAAWPIGASSLLTQLHANLGLVMLGLIATFQQTGIYNSAYRLVFFLMTLDRVFYTVFFPVVARFIENQPDRLAELVGTAVRMILALSIPLCVGASILARPILEAVFAAEYSGAVPVLQVLVWFLPLSMFNSLAGYTLLAAGRDRQFLKCTAAGVAVAVLFNLAAVPLAGAAGAAVAIVAGEAFLLVLMGRCLLRMVTPRLEPRTLAPLAAAAGMAIVVCLLRNMNLFGCIGLGLLTYLVLLLLLRGITAEDIGLTRDA